MGSLQQVSVQRADGVTFTGYAWSLSDGTYECFWDEGSVRHNFFFNAKGEQIKVAVKRYKLHWQT